MSPVRVGAYLTQLGVDGVGSLASHARHAQDVGLESVRVGDHLIPALRPVARAAKQVVTLHRLSGDRVLLGVGSGGDGDAGWRAVGVPHCERDKRIGAALEEVVPRNTSSSIFEVLPRRWLVEQSFPVSFATGASEGLRTDSADERRLDEGGNDPAHAVQDREGPTDVLTHPLSSTLAIHAA